MKIVFNLDVSKCSACGACAVACMDQNDIDTKNGQAPFRIVFDYEESMNGQIQYTYASMACMHCSDAPCIKGCPSGCISKDEDTGLTVYDNANCIGCRSCALACPYGAPSFGADGKMLKCDGCVERVKRGMEPACTRVCPVGALTFHIAESDDSEPESVKVYPSYLYIDRYK